MVTALTFKTKVRSQKYKKARYAIENVSKKEISKIIKEFEKISNVPYVKRIPKHEPTSSYFHLVRQLEKCIMRSDEHNRNVHGSYAEETAPSSNVNVTEENKSKDIIIQETLSENQSQYVNESECNTVNKTLSENNSADVPDNVITELKDDEPREPSVTGKVTSYFNTIEYGRNILNQIDVTYQRAFMASSVREGYYIPSPARERYYDQLAKILINSNVRYYGTINNDKLNQAITVLKAESKAGHERNILNMTQVDEYKSPGKKKDVSTINDLAYHNLDEYEDEISD